jgi:hypothetical protein
MMKQRAASSAMPPFAFCGIKITRRMCSGPRRASRAITRAKVYDVRFVRQPE